MSNCTNRLGKYQETINQCTMAIQIDPKALKAYKFRSAAHENLGNLEEALKDKLAAIKIEPNNKEMRAEYEVLKKKKAAAGSKPS